MNELLGQFWGVVQAVGGFTAVAGAAGFIGSRLFEGRMAKAMAEHKAKLDKELGHHRAELAAQHARDLEVQRSELRAMHFDREAIRRQLHQRRFEVIQTVYRDLVLFVKSANETMHGHDDQTIEQELCLPAFPVAFERYRASYYANRVFLEPSVCEFLEALEDAVREAVRAFHADDGRQGGDEEAATFERAIGPLLEQVEHAVRDVLLVNDAN